MKHFKIPIQHFTKNLILTYCFEKCILYKCGSHHHHDWCQWYWTTHWQIHSPHILTSGRNRVVLEGCSKAHILSISLPSRVGFKFSEHFWFQETPEGNQDGVVGIVIRVRAEWSGLRIQCWSQWPCGLRRGSAAALLLGLWVRISPGAWIFVLSLLYKDTSMEHKVTWRRTEGFKGTNRIKGNTGTGKKKNPGKGKKFLCPPKGPDRLWWPSNLLSSGYWILFPWFKSSLCVRLTSDWLPVPSLRINGAMPPTTNHSLSS
jgi:hypothetical protein